MADLLTTFAFQSGATISDCGLYRYHLWRVWDDEKPTLCFVMLNPSTADAAEDDPTIRRCIGFAKRDGYGGISVRNLFALRATNPAELSKAKDPVGPDNDKHLFMSCALISRLSHRARLVAAWGKLPSGRLLRARAQRGINIVRVNAPHCLGVNKDGSPKHPLYLANTPMTRWLP